MDTLFLVEDECTPDKIVISGFEDSDNGWRLLNDVELLGLIGLSPAPIGLRMLINENYIITNRLSFSPSTQYQLFYGSAPYYDGNGLAQYDINALFYWDASGFYNSPESEVMGTGQIIMRRFARHFSPEVLADMPNKEPRFLNTEQISNLLAVNEQLNHALEKETGLIGAGLGGWNGVRAIIAAVLQGKGFSLWPEFTQDMQSLDRVFFAGDYAPGGRIDRNSGLAIRSSETLISSACPPSSQYGSDELKCLGCGMIWGTNEDKPICPKLN